MIILLGCLAAILVIIVLLRRPKTSPEEELRREIKEIDRHYYERVAMGYNRDRWERPGASDKL